MRVHSTNFGKYGRPWLIYFRLHGLGGIHVNYYRENLPMHIGHVGMIYKLFGIIIQHEANHFTVLDLSVAGTVYSYTVLH